jgi:hypothetical protein
MSLLVDDFEHFVQRHLCDELHGIMLLRETKLRGGGLIRSKHSIG